MRKPRKLVSVLLLAVMLTSLLFSLKSNENVEAAEKLGTPKFTLKKANSGTGVKIVISKTKGAVGFDIILAKCDNAYSQYLPDNVDDKYGLYTVAHINKAGTKKHSYTIKGLPKGTYTFRVAAYAYDLELDWYDCKFSKDKKIKIKAAKRTDSKNTENIEHNFNNVEIGDVIQFGSYEQDDNMKNGKEPLEWIVLSKNGNQILVLSKYVIDALPYDKDRDTTWETCSLRKWLNEYFYDNAFGDIEKKQINSTTLTTRYGRGEVLIDTPASVESVDSEQKILIFSLNELFELFGEFDAMKYRCATTQYAVAQGVQIDHGYGISEDNTLMYIYSFSSEGDYSCYWWTRRETHVAYMGFVIENDGNISALGGNPLSFYGVRPAMWINLE